MPEKYRHFIPTATCQECDKIVLSTFKKTEYYFTTIILKEKKLLSKDKSLMYWVWGGTSTLLTPLVTLSNNQGPCGRRCMKLCLSFRFCVHLCTYNEIERLKNGKNNPNFWFPIAMLIWETKHTLIFSKFISFFLGSHARVLVQCGYITIYSIH